MIDLEPRHLDLVVRLLREKVPLGFEVRVFGSRVTGGAKRYSDLDLALVGPSPLEREKLEDLRMAFSESDLPILVDILDWARISPGFREVIKEKYEVLAY